MHSSAELAAQRINLSVTRHSSRIEVFESLRTHRNIRQHRNRRCDATPRTIEGQHHSTSQRTRTPPHVAAVALKATRTEPISKARFTTRSERNFVVDLLIERLRTALGSASGAAARPTLRTVTTAGSTT